MIAGSIIFSNGSIFLTIIKSIIFFKIKNMQGSQKIDSKFIFKKKQKKMILTLKEKKEGKKEKRKTIKKFDLN